MVTSSKTERKNSHQDLSVSTKATKKMRNISACISSYSNMFRFINKRDNLINRVSKLSIVCLHIEVLVGENLEFCLVSSQLDMVTLQASLEIVCLYYV